MESEWRNLKKRTPPAEPPRDGLEDRPAHPPTNPEKGTMAPPSDTALLLRVHAEQQWLHSELMPVLEQLENPDLLGPGEMGAALAYLEVTWEEALRRAAETDSAYAGLTGNDSWDPATTVLVGEARRYYGWLRDMRRRLTGRTQRFLGHPASNGHGLAA